MSRLALLSLNLQDTMQTGVLFDFAGGEEQNKDTAEHSYMSTHGHCQLQVLPGVHLAGEILDIYGRIGG
jgi:hypothetical protein